MEKREEMFLGALIEGTRREVAMEGGEMKPVDMAAYERVARWIATEMETPTGKGLLMVGGVGTGKTLMATRVLPGIVSSFCRPDSRVYGGPLRRIYDVATLTAYELPESGYEAWARKRMASMPRGRDIMEGVYALRMVTIDDMGAEFRSQYENDRMFAFIDGLYRRRSVVKTVVTTNLTSKELIEKYGLRTCDRLLSMCDIVVFGGGSYRDTGKFYGAINNN